MGSIVFGFIFNSLTSTTKLAVRLLFFLGKFSPQQAGCCKDYIVVDGH
jgi:hypothetical protein